MEGNKFSYLNGFNTLNNKNFSYLKERLKDNNQKNNEIPSTSRMFSNNNNNQMNDNNDNNRTVTSTTDSTIDNSKKHYIYKKNVIKPKNKICIYKNIKNLNEMNNNLQSNFKNRFIKCPSSENLKSNQNSLENTDNKKNITKNNNEIDKSYLTKKIFENNYNNINNNNKNFYNGRRHISIHEPTKEKINDGNNETYAYEYGFKKDFINIEDLLLFDEKFNDVLKSINEKINISNECFELINFYKTSSLINKFEQYFNEPKLSAIIHTSVMLILFNSMLVYHISFDPSYLNTCYDYLATIIGMNHKTFLLLCEYISLKISSSAIENDWVKRLFKLLKENLVHLNKNDKEFMSYLTNRGYNLAYNNSFYFIYEIKFYSSMIQKYIKALLKNLSDDNMTTSFNEIINNISTISIDEINDFFRKKVIRIINKNASVAGSDASLFGWGGEHETKVPYLTNKTNKKFTLVLDLDETLICFIPNPEEECKGTLKFRPGLTDFLLAVKEKYEVVTFTSATKEYADPIENAIEQNTKYFDARLYRHHTIIYENDFVKDIKRIGRPLDKIIIVDNMPQNFRLQKENGIVIKAFWGDDIYDNALTSLKEILLKIADEFTDIRKGLVKYKDEILNKVSSTCARREHIE